MSSTNTQADLPSIILLFGGLWYFYKTLWQYKLSSVWHAYVTFSQHTDLYYIVEALAAFSMTIATAIMFSLYILRVDDSKWVYLLFVFALGGPAADIAFDAFPSKGAACYVVSLLLFACVKNMSTNQPSYFVVNSITLGLSVVGIIIALRKQLHYPYIRPLSSTD